MKITSERLENCQVRLEIEVDEARMEKAMKKVARRISRESVIPGFRPGKAPYSVVVRRVGKEILSRQAFEDMSEAVVKEALEQAGIEPYDQVEVEDLQFEPVRLTLIVPVAPVVELGDYRAIRVEPPDVSLDEAEVEKTLERIQRAQGQWQPVERPAQWDDLVVVDIVGTIGDEVVLKNEERELILTADSSYPAPGFQDEIVGVSAGQDAAFDLRYPEDIASERLAGQEVHFEVHIHEVKELELPPLDDELAQTVGDYETLDDLRAEIRTNLQRRMEREAEEKYATEVLTKVVEGATIEFPSVMVEDEIDRIVADQQQRLKQEGLSYSDFLAMNGKTEEEHRRDLRPMAENRVRRYLVLGKIVELEKLKVNEEEIEAAIEARSLLFGEHAAAMREVFSSPAGVQAVASDILGDKAWERLLAIAKGEAPELEEDEEAEEEEKEDEGTEEEAVPASAEESAGDDEAADEAPSVPEEQPADLAD